MCLFCVLWLCCVTVLCVNFGSLSGRFLCFCGGVVSLWSQVCVQQAVTDTHVVTEPVYVLFSTNVSTSLSEGRGTAATSEVIVSSPGGDKGLLMPLTVSQSA